MTLALSKADLHCSTSHPMFRAEALSDGSHADQGELRDESALAAAGFKPAISGGRIQCAYEGCH